MMIREQWKVEANYRDHCTGVMVEHLAALRAKAGLTQKELSSLVGISRQTYYAYENKKRVLPWNTYLSLLLFFDTNVNTHSMLRDVGAYPTLHAGWDDDEAISEIIRDLNFGRFAVKAA